MVCYILGIKPPFHIVDGFIHRVWRAHGVHKVVMLDKGVFMVRFRSVDEREKAIKACHILYDRKPVIVKIWSPKLDISVESVNVLPTWIQFPGIPLKYWGQSSLHKMAL